MCAKTCATSHRIASMRLTSMGLTANHGKRRRFASDFTTQTQQTQLHALSHMIWQTAANQCRSPVNRHSRFLLSITMSRKYKFIRIWNSSVPQKKKIHENNICAYYSCNLIRWHSSRFMWGSLQEGRWVCSVSNESRLLLQVMEKT